MSRALVASGWGLLLGLGLGVAGLTGPLTILGFLDLNGILGAWDPTLGIVLTVAVLIYAPAYRLLLRRGAPLMGSRFDLPTKHRIDARLVAGATLFGAGWGIAGMCPGANLAALGSGDPRVALFAVSWTGSLVLVRHLDLRRATRPLAPPSLAQGLRELR